MRSDERFIGACYEPEYSRPYLIYELGHGLMHYKGEIYFDQGGDKKARLIQSADEVPGHYVEIAEGPGPLRILGSGNTVWSPADATEDTWTSIWRAGAGRCIICFEGRREL